MRIILALVLFVFTAVVPLAAQPAEQPAVSPSEWQDVITGQLDAFRKADGATALTFAGAGFKANYSDPEQFYAAIVASGYAPLVTSRSHSFGGYERPAEGIVVQTVNLVGPDQKLYQALYQLRQEPEGWRIQGVALQQQQGMGV